MRIATFYSHLNGYEYLLVHQPAIWSEIEEVVKSVDASACRTKKSKEKRMLGKMLYSPEAINKCFETEFQGRGWGEERTRYWVTDDFQLIRKTVPLAPEEQRLTIEAANKVPIDSYNQTDFVKDRVAVEVQFGKYAFIAYDVFVKHMAFYVGDKIDVGVEILAMKAMQVEMSSGPGYYERGLYDIARQGRGIPAVPLVLIGVEP